jgi:hypothetical protein
LGLLKLDVKRRKDLKVKSGGGGPLCVNQILYKQTMGAFHKLYINNTIQCVIMGWGRSRGKEGRKRESVC